MKQIFAIELEHDGPGRIDQDTLAALLRNMFRPSKLDIVAPPRVVSVKEVIGKAI